MYPGIMPPLQGICNCRRKYRLSSISFMGAECQLHVGSVVLGALRQRLIEPLRSKLLVIAHALRRRAKSPGQYRLDRLQLFHAKGQVAQSANGIFDLLRPAGANQG